MEKTFDRTTTEGSARYFQNCVRNGDVEGALSCFDPEAIYVTGPGTQVTGKESIRAALAQVCALKPDLQAQRSADFTAGDIAGWVDEWTLKATTPDGTRLDLKGVSADVLIPMRVQDEPKYGMLRGTVNPGSAPCQDRDLWTKWWSSTPKV